MKLASFFYTSWKIIIFSILIFSVYHLIRDVLQIFKIDTAISASLGTNKNWCNPYCDFVTIPPEVFIIISSVIILYRKKLGVLGIATIAVFCSWSAVFVWSYIFR